MSWSRFGWLALALSGPAWAQVQPAVAHVAVEVTEPGALQVDAALLRRLLELKLDAEVSVSSDGEATPSVTTRVTPGAAADSMRATLHWCDAAPGIAESVSLPSTSPEARARALALVIGELNRARPDPAMPRAEGVPVPRAPTAPTVHLRDPTTPPPTPTPATPAFLLSVGMGSRSYRSLGSSFMFHAQGGVRVALAREPRLSLRLEPGFEFGEFEDPLGRAELFRPGLGAGVELETGGDSLRLVAGPRLEMGWLFANPLPGNPESVGAWRSSFSLGAVVAVALRAPVYRGVLLQVEFEFGYGAFGLVARGDDRLIATNTGPLFGLSSAVLFPSL